jgi:uridine kinase
LHNNQSITKPIYTFGLHKDTTEIIKPKPVIILDGLFAFNPLFQDLIDFKIFVEANEEVRLKRRIERDEKERGYPKQEVLERWNKTVEPMYKLHVLPQKSVADLIIINNSELVIKSQ